MNATIKHECSDWNNKIVYHIQAGITPEMEDAVNIYISICNLPYYQNRSNKRIAEQKLIQTKKYNSHWDRKIPFHKIQHTTS